TTEILYCVSAYTYSDNHAPRIPHAPARGLSGPPWTVLILPYLEESARYQTFNVETGIYFGIYSRASAGNSYNQVTQQLKRNQKFECPSDPNSNDTNANNNYFAVQGGGDPTNVNEGKNDITMNVQPGFAGEEPRATARNGTIYTNSRV